MELTIKHLSGSRSGQTQRITAHAATLGRNPSNQIAFDPETDRAVSGNHAELQFRNGSWWIRDLGSSNGTWVNGERVTDRMIAPGEIVQLGTNGPKLQLDYQGTGPIIPDIPIAPGAPEGRTVMMMVGGAAPAAAAASASPFAGAPGPMAAPPRKKGGALRTVLILIFLLAVLAVAGIAAMVFLGGGSEPVAEKTAPPDEAAIAAAKEAEALQTQIEATKASIAQTQENLLKAQSDPTATTGENTAEVSDMQRQLQESQRLIDELARQLQEKNDQAAQQQAAPPPRNQKSGNISDAEQLRRVLALQAKQQQMQQPVAAAPSPGQPAPARTQTASAIPPAGQQPAAQPVVAQPAAAAPAPMNLVTNKKLKKRIRVRASDSEIPLPDLPDGGADDVARLMTSALNSMGDIIVSDTGEDGALSVSITNFKDNKKTSVDTEAVGRTVGAIAGIAGRDVVTSPANVRSGSRDSEISIQVRAFDRGAVQIAEVQPSAAARASKTQLSVASLTLGQEAASGDNPMADVVRKTVADAVDGIRDKLDAIQWTGTILDHEAGGPATLNCGSQCGIEVGDVFDVLSAGRPVGRVKVTYLDSQQATAQVLSGAGSLNGRMVRFAGRETESAIGSRQRSLQMREKAKVHQGPGRSFREVRELPAGTRVRYLYSVGVWAKATDGKGTFWVPMKSAQVIQ